MAYINLPKKKRLTTSERNKKRHAVYATREWKEIRKVVLMDNPICAICNKKIAEHVHHLKPFLLKDGTVDYERAYGLDNLIPICAECHTEIHAEDRKKEKENGKETEPKITPLYT